MSDSQSYTEVFSAFVGKRISKITATRIDRYENGSEDIGGNMQIFFEDGSCLDLITCGCCGGIGCEAK